MRDCLDLSKCVFICKIYKIIINAVWAISIHNRNKCLALKLIYVELLENGIHNGNERLFVESWTNRHPFPGVLLVYSVFLFIVTDGDRTFSVKKTNLTIFLVHSESLRLLESVPAELQTFYCNQFCRKDGHLVKTDNGNISIKYRNRPVFFFQNHLK